MPRASVSHGRFHERLVHEITPFGGFIVAALMAASDIRGTACIAAMLLATAWYLMVSD